METNNLFNSEGSIYMGSKNTIKQNSSIGIFGVNYDGTTSYKPGARFGPSSIRNVSQSLETYCPVLDKDLEDINYVDLGSLIIDFNDVESVIKTVNLGTKHLLKKKLKPIILGGEHSITTGVIKGLIERYPDLIVIQLDAHADLRDSYLNNKNSHACTMKRCLEILPKKTIFQIGIRSGTKSEFLTMNNNKQLINFNTGDGGSGGNCNKSFVFLL